MGHAGTQDRLMEGLLFLAPLSLFLETGLPIGLFVPGGDTLLLALGAWAAEGGLEAFPLLPLLFLGSFLGHLLGYALGRYGGKALRKRFSQDLWQKGERLLLRFGPLALLLALFLGVVRTLVPFLFGALGFPLGRFLSLVAFGPRGFSSSATSWDSTSPFGPSWGGFCSSGPWVSSLGAPPAPEAKEPASQGFPGITRTFRPGPPPRSPRRPPRRSGGSRPPGGGRGS